VGPVREKEIGSCTHTTVSKGSTENRPPHGGKRRNAGGSGKKLSGNFLREKCPQGGEFLEREVPNQKKIEGSSTSFLNEKNQGELTQKK